MTFSPTDLHPVHSALEREKKIFLLSTSVHIAKVGKTQGADLYFLLLCINRVV